MDYIDTSVLVYALLYDNDKKSEAARRILEEVGDGKRTVTTSVITISELTWALWKLTKNKEFAMKQVQSLLLLKNIRFVPLSPEISILSITLMNTYAKLRPYDAVHLATCVNESITTIISDDSVFDGINGVQRVRLS